MDLGEKIRHARLEAGMSQRQLCGAEITRNMLSQIEHGTAKPSMSTLQFLARQLGRPVSWFLEEDGAVSTNAACMEQAWQSFETGDPAGALRHLESYRGPDALLDREHRMLTVLSLLAAAEKSIEDGREIYARKLLNQARDLEAQLPWLPELRQRRLLLLSRLGEKIAPEELPPLHERLLLHARAALDAGSPGRAAALLDGDPQTDDPRWQLLRAEAAMAQSEYASAANYLLSAQGEYADKAIPLLEQCYRELGDYKSAYFYACKAREHGGRP